MDMSQGPATAPAAATPGAPAAQPASPVPDARGTNLYLADAMAAPLFATYLPAPLMAHLAPHFERLGALAGGRLDELAGVADRNPPTLSVRNRRGIDESRIDKHPAYVEMERLGFAEFGLAALSHRGGVLGWPEPMPPAAKYALTYLFVQAEFGLCCPISMTDSLARTLRRFGEPALVERYLPMLTSLDFDELRQGAMFMTEQGAGSDVAATATLARPLPDGSWALTGDKWFCSNPDAGFAMVLARSEDVPGHAGISLFLLPRELPDGARNAYRILRLKDKLGTRSMASAEVDFDGALALRVADFRRTVDVVLNTSRLYNAVVAAGFLQRAWREADAYARARVAFGQPILGFPGIARTVAGLRTEAYAARASSFALAACADRLTTGRAQPGEAEAYRFLVNCNKIWTALTCPAGVRQAIEVLGGNGAIEEFSVLPRLLRDSLVIEAWEGGHGVLCAQIARDSRKLGLHRTAFAWLRAQAEAHGGVPAGFDTVTERFARVMEGPHAETFARDVVEELRPLAQACLLHAAADPLEAAARAHLLATTARGWDPLEEPGLMERVAVLTG
jgi:alkylation response protein AidB-like acyl-CoA dehydrogenase